MCGGDVWQLGGEAWEHNTEDEQGLLTRGSGVHTGRARSLPDGP